MLKSDGMKHKILIIEDDKSNRTLLRHHLNESGYLVAEADDGKKGFELFLSYDFSLVLIDYYMPVMDGMQTLVKMREIDSKKNIPIIFLTASKNEKTHEDCIDFGADDILLKPYDIYYLKIKIQSWLRIKDTMDEIEERKTELYLRDTQRVDDLNVSNTIIKNRTLFDRERIKNIKILDKPAEIMSGDIVLSEISPSGNQIILFGDFTGHGLPAALGSMVVSDLFYSMTMKGFTILEIAKEINRKLKITLPVNRFMAGSLIEIDFKDNIISIIQAGLPEILLCDNESKELKRIASVSVPLGIQDSEKIKLPIQQIKVNDHSKLFIYSDGLIESMNEKGEVFGQEKLINTIKLPKNTLSAFEKIKNTYKKFMINHQSFDDVTCIEVVIDKNLVNNQSLTKQQSKKMAPAEWSMNISFDINILKQADPIPSIVDQVVNVQGHQLGRQKLYLILTELYSNSLEHGILGLDSEIKNKPDGFSLYYEMRDEKLKAVSDGNVVIRLSHKPKNDGGTLCISFSDSGSGFDFDEINYNLANNTEFKGRGIGLIMSLSDIFYYEGDGSSAYVEFHWDQAA